MHLKKPIYILLPRLFLQLVHLFTICRTPRRGPPDTVIQAVHFFTFIFQAVSVCVQHIILLVTWDSMLSLHTFNVSTSLYCLFYHITLIFLACQGYCVLSIQTLLDQCVPKHIPCPLHNVISPNSLQHILHKKTLVQISNRLGGRESGFWPYTVQHIREIHWTNTKYTGQIQNTQDKYKIHWTNTKYK